MLENTEGAIKTVQSRETGNIWYTRRQTQHNVTSYLKESILLLRIAFCFVGQEPVGYSSTYYRNISEQFHEYLLSDG